MIVDETDVVEHSFGPSEDIVGLWNLSLLASIKVPNFYFYLFSFCFFSFIFYYFVFVPGCCCCCCCCGCWTDGQDTLESDERPSELSDIAEEPEEYQDCSSDGVS
jgi:hypothetical protein